MRVCSRIICVLSVSATALVVCSANSTAETTSQALIAGRLDGSGDIYLRLADATRETHGWGTPRDRASVTGAPLRIGSVTFRHGIGTHAPAELVFPAGGKYRWLTFHAGISEEMTAVGSVTVQVWLDGKNVHETPVMRVKGEPVYVSLPLKGAKEVRIVGTDAGDGIAADNLNFGNLRLCTSEKEPTPDTPKPSRPPAILPEHDLADKLPQRGATTTAPATRWQECMLTGNGRMGAMVFGRPYNETVVINHCKLYLPQGSREIVHDLADSMPAFKQTGLKAGKDGPAVVHRMMLDQTGQKIVNTDPFHPAFMLRVAMAKTSPQATNYVMTENFETGEVIARWTDEHGDWKRRLFASRPDNAVVMSISGPKGKVGCEVWIEIGHPLVKPEITVADGWISAHTVYAKGKGGYDSLVRVIASGGETSVVDDALSVSGADHVLLLMEVDTWRTPLPKQQSEAWAFSPKHPDFGPGHTTNCLPKMKQHLAGLSGRGLCLHSSSAGNDGVFRDRDAANRAFVSEHCLASDYDALLRPHAEVHGEFFSRVSLDLGGGADRGASSEVLLARAAEEHRASPALIERMYDACRYLIICSSGERPPNLQGIWTGTWQPAWSGDYTLDSNIQLEIQSLMSCNMPELMESYFQLVESWMPDCRLNARKFYGCRGAMSNARASNVCLLLHWGRWPGEQLISCLGWMAHFFYDYYQFTGDRKFLEKRAVPLMKEVALFYEDLLADTEDKNGKYRFFIGYSPEHGLSANTTFDIGVARAMLAYLIKSCEALSIESENIPKWKAMLVKMPPYLINQQGGLQEWSWPGAGENYNQRHHSHFLPLYQFCEFDRDRDPDVWKASEIAFQGKVDGWLHLKEGSNSNHITHGMMNQGQCAARLGRSDIVYEVLSRMTTRQYVYPSFIISYWPGHKGFGFDPVGTIPDVLNNSLVFSWERTLDIIPALPKQWPKGSISGVLARGQLKIDRLAWDVPAGKIDLSLTSGVEQAITLRLPPSCRIESTKVISGEAQTRPVPGKTNYRTLSLPAGKTCRVQISFQNCVQDSSSVKSYPDGRPTAKYRLDAEDAGRIFKHGPGPEDCDALGAREASVVLHDGTYHLFYDGAEPGVGWLACLATSTDLKNWQRHGPVFSFGEPGTLDSHTATSPWFIRHDGLWHAYYVGCQKTTPPPDCIPHMPYFTLKAEAKDLKGPWRKRYDVKVVTTQPGTYRSDTASPGYLFWHEGKLWKFFSCARDVTNASGKVVHLRSLGMAYAPHPDGPWTVLGNPILPLAEQIENSSLYHEATNGWWFLFTNHVGVNESGHEWTDAIWVYWSKDPTKWDPKRKAVVLDGQNCTWSKKCVGMPSVIPMGDRLALFYDAPGGDSISHMGRDIGLARLDLPLTPPTE